MNKGYFVSEAMMSLGKKYFAITIESWWGYIRTGPSALKITENAIYIERHVRIPITYTPGEKNGKSWEKEHTFLFEQNIKRLSVSAAIYRNI